MKLIDADALKENAFEVYTKEYGRIDVVGVEVIDEAPDIDTTLRGEWIYKDRHDGWKEYQCSNCPCVKTIDTFTGETLPKHCPDCGSLNIPVVENPEKHPGMLLFQARRKLAMAYDKWVIENGVKDCPFSVVTFLEANGLIKVGKAYEFIKGGETDAK